MRRTLLALAVVGLLAAGCGDDDDDTATTDTTTTEPAETTTSSTTEATSSTSTAGDGDLPGERIDLFPYEDAALAVVGVEADDVLHVRAEPDPSADTVTELDPLADGLTATGHNRQLGDGAIWAEVDTGEDRGWVNTAYVAQPGTTDDATARLYPETTDRPVADTLEQLAEQVAADAANGGEGAPEPRVVIVDGPSVGDLGEVTVDVLGYPDDSVYGERLHLFAEEEGGESFRLRTIEATTLCRRGVDAEGRCT